MLTLQVEFMQNVSESTLFFKAGGDSHPVHFAWEDKAPHFKMDALFTGSLCLGHNVTQLQGVIYSKALGVVG